MRKNKIMRFASLILVLTLLSTSVISGTFAKYVTSATANTSARVANWGFKENTISIDNLFSATYDNVSGSEKVIAPGTDGSTEISFVPAEGNPEVAYKITVKATSTVDMATNTIVKNPNIQWALYEKDGTPTWGKFDKLLTDINDLSEASIAPNTAPKLNTTYVIAWRWLINEVSDSTDAQNVMDTAMGNANPLEAIDLTISIVAEQID